MKLGKKLLSLLTVLCLTLSLFPTMALADGNVSVGGTGTSATSVSVAGKTLNENTPYLVKNENTYNNSQSQVEGATYATFDAKTGTLTLNNYNYTGTSGISSTGGLTINLVGINTITTSGANSIYSTGALTITSDSKGSLTAENPTSDSAQTTIYSTSDITITGNATVTAKINGTAQAINSDSQSGKITIAENATVTAINGNSTSGTKIAVLAGSGTSKPTGTIEVTGSATLTAQGYDKALACKSMSETSSPKGFTYPDGSTIKVSKNYDGSDPETTYAEGSLGSYKYVEVTHAVANYNVWVGGTQVTSANMNNVLNDATATVKYTPADGETAQKLTLNGMRITNTSQIGITASNDLTIALSGENEISSSAHAIEMTSGTLTITGPGSLNASSSSGQTTIYTQGSGDVIINGGAQITVKNTNSDVGDAIHLSGTTNKNLTITGNNTQVIAQKSGSATAINGVATLTVSDGATLTAQSNRTAISCTTLSCSDNDYIAKASIGCDGSNPEPYVPSNVSNYKYVHVYPKTASVKHYGVWIGSTELTSANTTSISGVSYEPTTQTLTLNGAHITGAPNRQYTSTIKDACGIYAKHDLTIKLSGSNTVIGSENADEQEYGNYGIFVSGRLIFTSASDSVGSITASGGTSSNNGNAWVPGVYASGITVNNCNVTVSGGTAEHDTYPVSYAMSTAPTLVGVKATASRNRDGSDAETYSSSNNRNYKWIKIEQDATNTTIASPVIEPDSCYFTNNVTVTISCLTNGARIYYSTDGTNFSEYRNAIPINDTTTITAYATKDDKTSATITATFTKRDASATPVTSVILDKSELDLKTNQNENLVATVTPANASDATVVWTSNDPSVATIDARGNVTTVGIGKARITATTKDGGYIAFCDVIVTEREPVQITFSDESGTVSPANTNAYGKLSTLPTPTRSGYSFDGWYTEAEGGTAVTTDTVFDKATTIYAHWTRNSSSGSHTTYYPVNTPAKSEGGSVVVSQKSASRGTTVTVTATAASGYQVAQVSAVDKDGKTVSLTDKGDGVYTFVMPASKVDVTARFAQVQKPEEKDPYGDVSKDSYYYDAVKWAAETGVTTGVGDGLFAPEWVCTRGQIVTFLWRASGSPAPKATELPFTDVTADAYYAQAVLWAVENGITNGTSETTFSPDQTCTRAHAVAFLYRMSGSPAAAGSTFSDVAADAYYSTAVAWAVEKGITNGTSGTTFSPDDTCTRGQIVTFLYRLAQTK